MLLGFTHLIKKSINKSLIHCSHIYKQKHYYSIINKNQSLSTTAKLFNGEIITIYVPGLEKAQRLLESNTNSVLPGPQLLFYLVNELAQQIPNFNINNAELTKVFTNSWRNSSK